MYKLWIEGDWDSRSSRDHGDQAVSSAHNNDTRRLNTLSLSAMDNTSPAESTTRRRKRSAVACTKCHQRKVRCDVSNIGLPCSNCVHDRAVCKAPLQRDKPYVMSRYPAKIVPCSVGSDYNVSTGPLCHAYCLEHLPPHSAIKARLQGYPKLMRAF